MDKLRAQNHRVLTAFKAVQPRIQLGGGRERQTKTTSACVRTVRRRARHQRFQPQHAWPSVRIMATQPSYINRVPASAVCNNESYH